MQKIFLLIFILIFVQCKEEEGSDLIEQSLGSSSEKQNFSSPIKNKLTFSLTEDKSIGNLASGKQYVLIEAEATNCFMKGYEDLDSEECQEALAEEGVEEFKIVDKWNKVTACSVNGFDIGVFNENENSITLKEGHKLLCEYDESAVEPEAFKSYSTFTTKKETCEDQGLENLSEEDCRKATLNEGASDFKVVNRWSKLSGCSINKKQEGIFNTADTDYTLNPGHVGLCEFSDDELADTNTYYVDSDEDGLGNPEVLWESGSSLAYSLDNTDCDDSDPRVLSQKDDGDCDGIMTEDDCNDSDSNSTARLDDPDCDGLVGNDDCDGTDFITDKESSVSGRSYCDGISDKEHFDITGGCEGFEDPNLVCLPVRVHIISSSQGLISAYKWFVQFKGYTWEQVEKWVESRIFGVNQVFETAGVTFRVESVVKTSISDSLSDKILEAEDVMTACSDLKGISECEDEKQAVQALVEESINHELLLAHEKSDSKVWDILFFKKTLAAPGIRGWSSCSLSRFDEEQPEAPEPPAVILSLYQGTSATLNLTRVWAHEIGHGFGLQHPLCVSDRSQALMMSGSCSHAHDHRFSFSSSEKEWVKHFAETYGSHNNCTLRDSIKSDMLKLSDIVD